MKKQETVEGNFKKVRDQWKVSQINKISNLQSSIEDIDKKILKLQDQKKVYEKQILFTSALEGPCPPTQEQRVSASKAFQLDPDDSESLYR